MMRIITITLILIFFTYCKSESERAKDYHDKIIYPIKKLAHLENQIEAKDGPEVERLIRKFKLEVAQAKLEIEKSDTFNEDSSLKEAGFEICNFYQELIDGKWSLKGQPAIQKKKEDLFNNLKQRQINFAEKYHFILNNSPYAR